MRKMMIVGLVGASLGLASCGAQASIDQAVSSLGSSSDVQLHFTGSASGPDATQVQQILNVLSLEVNFSNPSGAALSQSGATADVEFLLYDGSRTLADVRVVDSNLYVLVNLPAVATVPGVSLPASQVEALQLILGGRWFEFPKSVITSMVPAPTTTSTAQTAREVAAVRALFDDLSKLIASTAYTTLPSGGYSETGTLASVVNAVLPTIESLSTRTLPSNTVKGTYTLSVTTSGATATGGSITVTAPSGAVGQGNDTIGLSATVAHASVDIAAPTGATVITSSLLKGLLSQARG
ncbi:MAG: hypothetical protein ACYDB2_10730 [Acidimicrobiales bacterium]